MNTRELRLDKSLRYISRKNNYKARKHFGIVGQRNLVLHHIDIYMIYDNPERYAEWRPEDLVVMERGKHIHLHRQLDDWLKGKPFTEAHRNNISKALQGRVFTDEWRENLSYAQQHKAPVSDIARQHLSEACSGEKNGMYGKKQSEDSKKKNSESNKQYRWVTNGIENKRVKKDEIDTFVIDNPSYWKGFTKGGK